jgi:hypothetical protein
MKIISEARRRRLATGGGLVLVFGFFALFGFGLSISRTGWLSFTARLAGWLARWMSDERGVFAFRDALLSAGCRAGDMDSLLIVLSDHTVCSD